MSDTSYFIDPSLLQSQAPAPLDDGGQDSSMDLGNWDRLGNSGAGDTASVNATQPHSEWSGQGQDLYQLPYGEFVYVLMASAI